MWVQKAVANSILDRMDGQVLFDGGGLSADVGSSIGGDQAAR